MVGKQKIIAGATDVSVSEGQSVVLKCTVANRDGVVQWTQNGIGLGDSRGLPGYPRFSMFGSQFVKTSLKSGASAGYSGEIRGE